MPSSLCTLPRYTAQRGFSGFQILPEGVFAAMLTLQIVLAALIGLAFGSFLNVCISRLPRHRSIVRPASHCPHCKAPIAAYDNVPLISYAVLGGRCRHCSKPISWRYPLVEAAVAALAVANILYVGADFWGVSFAIFCAVLFALAVCDIETMQLPDTFTLTLLVLGILYRAGDGLLEGLRYGAAYGLHAGLILGLRGTISAAATALVLLLLRWIYSLLRHRQGLGLGDVKLAAAIAAWLGARQMCLVFFLAVVTGALAALIVLAVRGREKTRVEGPLAVPFGTFLALGAIYCTFLGNATLRWYLDLFH
jgi:leader peptidase (prepilin peptidase)/N-methyltransferase